MYKIVILFHIVIPLITHVTSSYGMRSGHDKKDPRSVNPQTFESGQENPNEETGAGSTNPLYQILPSVDPLSRSVSRTADPQMVSSVVGPERISSSIHQQDQSIQSSKEQLASRLEDNSSLIPSQRKQHTLEEGVTEASSSRTEKEVPQTSVTPQETGEVPPAQDISCTSNTTNPMEVPIPANTMRPHQQTTSPKNKNKGVESSSPPRKEAASSDIRSDEERLKIDTSAAHEYLQIKSQQLATELPSITSPESSTSRITEPESEQRQFSLGDSPDTRVRVEDVSKYSWMFLTDVKTLPAINMGDMTYRLELEEPSDNDYVMNIARKRIGETPERMAAAIEELTNLLKAKNDGELITPWENSAWVIRFLRLRNYNIKEYYLFKAHNRYIYENLVPSHEIEVALQEIVGLLPNRDQMGRRIFIARASKWQPNKYSLLQVCRVAILLSEIGAYEPATQLAGVQIIFDVSGLTFQHIWQFSPTMAKKLVDWLLYSAPFRYEGIHIVKQPGIFRALFTTFKTFMTKELRSKIHFHGYNMKSLHKHISASSLPDIYGGTFPSPSLSSYEWEVLLKSRDEEYAKIDSYGFKPKRET